MKTTCTIHRCELDRWGICPQCEAAAESCQPYGRCEDEAGYSKSYPPERVLYEKAHAAGMAAGAAAIPETMYVGTPTMPFGNELDPNKPIYKMTEGCCGFAWINIKPATSRFAKWLKQHGHARTDHYAGGVTVWVSEFGQSMTRKEAYAHAFARVLREAGIARAYAQSRMD